MPTYREQQIDIVLDVRTRLEYWLGHLEGAECVPVHRLPEALARRGQIGKDARILVYCASGARSAAAAHKLRAVGYRHVVDAGGMSDALPGYTP